MQDRNLFETIKLKNSLTVYQKIMDTPYSVVEVTVPVGSAHNIHTIKPGTFHFLEHICCDRSQLFPDRHQFKQFIGLKSVQSNASTGPFSTSYYFASPNQHLHDVIPGFIASIFQPLITTEDIQLQKTIIGNERQRKERWFPSDTELGQYLSTKWQYDVPLELNQRLGSDHDLASITVTDLQTAHQHYLSPQTTIIYVGQQPNQLLLDLLAELPITQDQPPLPHNWRPMHWVKPQFHHHSFRDASRFQLYYGDFRPHAQVDLDQHIGLRFILNYLTNSVHGPLFHWLRQEKGYLYEIGQGSSTRFSQTEWWLRLPLSNLDQVEEVRQQLWDGVEQALQDQSAIDQEVTRQVGQRAFAFQTTLSLLQAASDDLEVHGRIIPESQLIAAIEHCRQPQHIKHVFSHYFDQTTMGSFLATPQG